MEPLRIWLLGCFRLAWADQPIELPSRKTRGLLAYLVLQRGRLCPRERLAELFWGHLGGCQARNNLRYTLSTLRHALEEAGLRPADYIISESGSLGFNRQSPYWLDVEAFEDLIESAHQAPPGDPERVRSLEEAVRLYGGDLLEESYEEWFSAEQERLRALYEDAVTELAEYHRVCGSYERAVALAKPLIKRRASEPREAPAPWQAAALLAEHFHRLGHLEEAFNHFLEAASLALYTAPKEATRLLDRAEETLNELKEGGEERLQREFDLWSMHAWLSHLLGEGGECRKAVEEMASLTERLGDARSMCEVHRRRFWLLFDMQGFSQAEEEARAAIKLARKLEDPRLEALALKELGNVSWALRAYQKALRSYRCALGILEELGDREAVADLANNLGNCYAGLGQYERALVCYRRAEGLKGELGDELGQALVRCNLGELWLELGKFEEAQALLEGAHQVLWRLFGERSLLGEPIWALGLLKFRRGQVEKALQYWQEARRLFEQGGRRRRLGLLMLDCALAHLERRDYQKALRELEKARRFLEEFDLKEPLALSLSRRARAILGLGRRKKALALSERAVEASKGRPWRNLPEIFFNHAQALSACARESEAHCYWLKAYEALKRQAAKIRDPELRRNYLRSSRLHREILAAWERLRASNGST
jgi:DNA-binding SARP family transcriptional activator/Tfp pilus assembly protein PilF